MRGLSASLTKKLASHVQAGDSAINANVWISRPTTQLVDDVFLEKQKIPFGTNVTKTSIAVCHPYLMRDATDIYVGYISGGTAKVAKAMYNHRMANHEWVDAGFSEAADDISLCFDGTMPKDTKGMLEFKTDEKPWVFWISGATLYCRKLGTLTNIVLAESNCTAVSAVRATWSEVDKFNFGLVVFFILSGNIYYRQLIDGEWTDAELVSFGPTGVTWQDVSASRTWDFRIAVQAKASDGSIYELFTQYMGIGTRSAEHFQINGGSFKGNTTSVDYHTFEHRAEHIELARLYNAAPYGGSYEIGVPSFVDVYNEDDGTGNWGKKVIFVFDKELNPDTVQASIACFYIADTWGVRYYPSSITMDRTGRKATLHFIDINNAFEECEAHYVPGSVVTMVDEVLAECSLKFTPKNLVPGDISFPEVTRIWNNDIYGREIAIKFNEPIVTIASGSESGFIVTVPECDYVPEGNVSDVIKPVVSVEGFSGVGEKVDIESGSSDNGLSVSGGVLSLGVLQNE